LGGAQGPRAGRGVLYCPAPVTPAAAPAVVIRPTPVAPPMNQIAPSGPAVMVSWEPPTGNSVTTPAGVIRPMFLAKLSVNHKLPSGPAAMPKGLEIGGLLVEGGSKNSVTLCP